ncbi:MAG TPA: co-chaperone GroES [Halothiobacillus sp.]|nr:co-chaperone GroES [Halothiobacillus sp.]
MKIRPLRDRVLVKRVEEERTTAGGIVLPDSAAEKPNRGEVIAVGPGKSNDKGEVRPISVKVGDIVLFSQYAGSKIKVDGEELLMMGEDDILGVIED